MPRIIRGIVVKILVATSNAGKKAELEALLDGDVEWLSLADLKNYTEVEEDGKTFEENAQKKALGYAKQSGLLTIADDSGLEIDALGGEPGVHSARFSGTHKDHSSKDLIDHENIAKVLRLMEDVPAEKRTARFKCCLCVASPEKVLIQTEGTLEGSITTEKRGHNGFGYDPVFYVPQKDKTTAQMSKEEKNELSHRGQAVQKLGPLLKDLINKTV